MSGDPFPGFQSGTRATIIPNDYFTRVLPQISEPSELIVSCYVFFALGRRSVFPRSVTFRSLSRERPLMQALAHLPAGSQAALMEGLQLATGRGTLLKVRAAGADDEAYVLHTDAVRRHLEAVGWAIAADEPALDVADVPAVRLNIYALYEENIGSLPPLLIDELEEAEKLYPLTWLEAAFREAVAQNRRNWKYISRILERWKLEGPDYEAPRRSAPRIRPERRRTIAGPYQRVVERRPDNR